SLNITIGDRSRPTGLFDDNGNPLYESPITYNNITQFDASNSIVISGLLPSSEDGYAISILGGDNSINLYTGGEGHTDIFYINSPIPVSFQITDVINVWCNDGDTDPTNNNDGEIHLRADGGNDGTYEFSITGENQTGSWQDFSESDTHEITGLRPGNYNIRVRKRILLTGVYCSAKEQAVVDGELLLGEEIVLE